VLLRLFMGYYFLYVGISRFLAWRGNGKVLTERFTELTKAGTQIEWFRVYLDRVIAPISQGEGTVLTILLLAAPLLLGLSLVLGLLTRLSTFLGFLLVLQSCLVKFFGANVDQMLFLQMRMAVLATLFFAGAGRTFGLDAVFWKGRIRRKYEPAEAQGARVTVGQVPRVQPTVKREPIPLAGNKTPKAEDTEGFFTPPSKPQTPGPRPQPKPEQKPGGGTPGA
jgi:uncharacterized membrane protein YphA (DoxX/SURF4 family)